MEPDDFSTELLFVLLDAPAYRVQFNEVDDLGTTWYNIDVNPMLNAFLHPNNITEQWREQIGNDNISKDDDGIFWITQQGLAHLKLLGAVEFTEDDARIGPVSIAP